MKRVLLPIDQDVSRAENQAETIADLFESDDAVAYLLHVFTDNREGASVIEIESARRVSDILEERGFEVEYRERSGDPSDEILAEANEIDADSICIAGRKRNPAGKLLFGSVTQDVILNTERPVLVCGSSEIAET